MQTTARLLLATGMGIVPALAFDSSSIDIHGFISQGYLHSSDNNWVAKTSEGTFQFNEAAINVSADLTDKLRAGIQFFAYDLGPVGNNKISVDWAFLDYRHNEFIGLRAGRTKVKNGLYNEYLDIDAVRPTIVIPQSVYYQMSFRETSLAANGVQAYGNIDAGGGGDFDYQVLVGSLNLDPEGSVGETLRNSGITTIKTLDSDLTANAAITWNTPVDGFRVGLTYQYVETIEIEGQSAVNIPVAAPGIGPLNVNHINISNDLEGMNTIVASLEYVWNDLTLSTEYRYIDYDSTTTQSVDVSGVGNIVLDGPTTTTTTSDGFYIQASYLFKDIWTATVYYSMFNRDTDDRNSDDPSLRLNDLALAMRCDINEYWNAKAEIHFMDGYGADGVLSSADDGSLEEDWIMFALKTTLSF